MKSLKAVLILGLVLIAVPAAFAQFQAGFSELDQQLDSICGETGHPIEDGTIVKIIWDRGATGPSEEDTIPILCDDPPACDPPNVAGTVNIVSFEMNGRNPDVMGEPGYFNMIENLFNSYGALPSPPQYYLEICLNSVPTRLRSNSFTLISGYQEVEMTSWTCVDSPCVGCEPPARPSHFEASDSTSCTGVVLRWDPYSETEVDSFFIYRGAESLARLPVTDTTFTDTTADSLTSYLYGIEARRICTGPPDTAFSARANDNGSRHPRPQIPTLQTVSTNLCDSIRVNWTYTSNTGLDSFVIKRGGVRVGAIHRGGTVGPRTFIHFWATGDTATYTVVGKNNVCGEGTPSSGLPGAALKVPVQVQNVVATDTLCNVINITWTDLPNESGYSLYRANSDGSGSQLLQSLPANTVNYPYSAGACFTVYRFWVVASNQCGSGTASNYDTGSMRCVPYQVTGVAATVDSFCTHVRISWVDLANETGYEIRRLAGTSGTPSASDSIRTVSAGVTTFNDSTAVAGQAYRYAVAAYNQCGDGTPSATVNGKRKAPPGQVTGVSATDSLCWGVRVTWTDSTREDGYQVKRNGTQIGTVGAGVTQYNDSTAVADVSYNYTVVAYNTCGSGGESSPDAGMKRGLPGQVANFTASDTSTMAIYLKWNNLANEDSFRIFRNGAFLAYNVANDTDYTDMTAGPLLATCYQYWVQAANTCGSGTASVPDSGCKQTALPAPTGLTASDDLCDSVLVTWNNVAGADSFVVKRDGAPLGVNTVPNDTTYGDLTAVPGARHSYTVLAYDFGLPSAEATPDSGGRRDIPAVVQGVSASEDLCDMVQISWTSQDNTDSFLVVRDGAWIANVTGVLQYYYDTTAVPGTTYLYGVIGKNACGEADTSATVTGLRLVFPSVPTGLLASDVLCDRIRVCWTASTGDVDYYRLKRDGDSLVVVSKDSTCFDDSTATEGAHDYTVAAVSEQCGASAESVADTGTRLVPAGVVANVAATSNRCDSVIVTWDAAPGDVDGYVVYVGTDSLGRVGPDTLYFAHVPDTAGQVYSYTVQAYSTECGPGNMSAADNGALLMLATTPSNLVVTTGRCDGVYLTWEASSGTFANYQILRDGSPLDLIATTQTDYLDTTATVGVHNYGVVAYSTNLTCPSSAATPDQLGERLPWPTAPDNVVASTDSCDAVYISWTSSSGTFDWYNVYRDYAFVDTVFPPDTTYRDTLATSGITFRYTVRAEDLVCGLTDTTNGADGLRQADAGVPDTLVATNGCDAVELWWHTSTGAPEGYKVYRDDVYYITVFPPDTTYNDTGAVRGVTYAYKVSAYTSGCGETAPSNTASAMRLPLPVQVTGLAASDTVCAGIELVWDDVLAAEVYYVFRNDTLIDSVVVTFRTASYLDTGVAPRSAHTYRVSAANICGAGDPSDPATGTRYDVPDVVTGVTASTSSCLQIDLSWTDVATETGYAIQRDTVYIDTADADVTTYTDLSASPGDHNYVVFAINHCGSAAGSTPALGTRIPGVAQVADVAASDTMCDRIDLTWTDLGNEDGFYVYRNGVVLDTLEQSVTTYTDTPDPGSYWYTVSAFNVCGEGVASVADTGYRATVPEQVIGLAATQDSCTSVTVTWTDVATEDYYRVYRGGGLIDSVLADITSYVDGPLTPGSYTYHVMAVNYCGEALLSDSIVGRVPDVPGVVSDVRASMDNCTTITVTWDDLTDELTYQLFRDDSLTPYVALSQNTVSYVDTPTIGAHLYWLRGLNECGAGDLSASATGVRAGPPTGQPVLSGPDSVCGSALLSWTMASDVGQYRVYRDGDSIATTTDTFATVTGNPGNHTFVIEPRNVCGPGPQSNPLTIYFIPGVPPVTGLTATTEDCITITLGWNPATDQKGYYIWRDTGIIDTVDAAAVAYVDSPAVGTYTYKVQAFNDCGPGLADDSVMGRRRGPPPPVTGVIASDSSCDGVTVTWDAVTDVLGYIVSRNSTVIDTVDVTTLFDAPGPGTYWYCVLAFNDCGSASSSVGDSGTHYSVPPQVTGVSATTNRCDSVLVTWNAAVRAVDYAVFRNDTFLVTVSDTWYADVPSVGSHAYKVRGVNWCGDGDLSDPATGTRLEFPGTPSSVVATDTLCATIHISWSVAAGDVDGYKILENGVQKGQVANDVFTFTRDTVGTFAYTVVAHSNECGDGSASAPDSGEGHRPAGAVTGLTFTEPAICDTVRITWTLSTGEVDNYIVSRDGVNIDTVGSAITRYTDWEVDDADTHAYCVTPYNRYCGLGTVAGPVNGWMLPLIQVTTETPDTVVDNTWFVVDMLLCPNVDSVRFYISRDGGVHFTHLRTATVPSNLDSVFVPHDSVAYPEAEFLATAHRDGRVDSARSGLFVKIPNGAVDEHALGIPTDFFLDQNYPNPFNPATTIRFGVPHVAEVNIEIFDILGRTVATVATGVWQPGVHSVVWNCAGCPSGMYVLRLQTEDRVMLRKMLLMK